MPGPLTTPLSHSPSPDLAPSNAVGSWADYDFTQAADPATALANRIHHTTNSWERLAYVAGQMGRAVFDRATGGWLSAFKPPIEKAEAEAKNARIKTAKNNTSMDKIVITGTHLEDSTEQIISAAQSSTQKIHFLGNGKDAVTSKQLKSIKKLIGPKTKIIFNVHGEKYQNTFYVMGILEEQKDRPVPLRNVFKFLTKHVLNGLPISPDQISSVTVDINSCEANHALDEIDALPKGVALTAHGPDTRTFVIEGIKSITRSFTREALPPLEEYVRHATGHPLTVGIAASYGKTKIKHTIPKPASLIPASAVGSYLWRHIHNATQYFYNQKTPGHVALIHANKNRELTDNITSTYALEDFYDALIHGQTRQLKTFFKTYGIHADSLSYKEDTPLTFSISIRDRIAETMTTLMEDGKADPNFPQKDGSAPLAVAAFAQRESAVKVLLENTKTNVNRRGKLGYTALHQAARKGDNAIATMLLDKKADPTVIGDDGLTPAAHAKNHGHHQTAALLKKAETTWKKAAKKHAPKKNAAKKPFVERTGKPSKVKRAGR